MNLIFFSEPIGAVGYANVLEIPMDFSDCSPLGVKPDLEVVVAKVTKRDYKAIWKRAILDQILLIRMEKANSTLKGKHFLFRKADKLIDFCHTSKLLIMKNN